MIKIKIIPNKIFHKLWKEANKDISKEEFIRTFTSPLSKNYINFYRKLDIDEYEMLGIFDGIYSAAKMTLNDIISISGIRKSELSDMFCIPIRTIEDWCSGKAKCNPYIRLFLLRYFRLINLGKWIEVECERKYKDETPKKYNSSSRKARNSSDLDDNLDSQTFSIEDNNYDRNSSHEDDYNEFSEIDALLESIPSHDFIKEDKEFRDYDKKMQERSKNSDVQKLLEETAYLSQL